MRPWLWLYRPEVPTARAQSVQVVRMAHAMASRGHAVTLCVEARDVDAAAILAWYGLEPVDGLRLIVLPRSRTLAGVAFRAVVAGWLARHRRRGVVYARSKRYAREVLRVPGARLVIEAHEVDSVQAALRGEDPAPSRALEAAVFRGAAGVVANAAGTLDLLRRTHPTLPPAVAIPNGTAAVPASGEGTGVGYVGSVRPWKDLDTLARAAHLSGLAVTVVGAADPGEARRLEALGGGFLAALPPVPYRDVPATLGSFRVLALPLGEGVLPEHLSSPLKLADALATGLPVVAADVPSVRAIAGDGFVPYRSGDPVDLARALRRAHDDEALRAALSAPRVHTWADRAALVESFVESLP